ncbi:hypothetical protein A6769_12060 [Nostoc punctiforme NIES-2108]|uniref:Uncharacterized protein n=1 Tax=Nostoc punctiforme NIES-2108 TaxID=1356359 RepID=A0A367RNL2_NOSPU|nr:hypothetical protein A6769_12060 [Nostoc punctiforme NIES-2108]
MTVPTDEQLKEVAEMYILNQYAPPGFTAYLYEEQDDPDDDTTCHIYSTEWPKPDEEALSSWEIVDTTIESVTIEERDEEAREWTVLVEALVTVCDSKEEGEEEEDPEVQSRNISVYLTSDSNGELYVFDAEE